MLHHIIRGSEKPLWRHISFSNGSSNEERVHKVPNQGNVSPISYVISIFKQNVVWHIPIFSPSNNEIISR